MIDIGQLSPWLIVLAPLVVVFAYTVFGMSGFGSTVISVPILAHFLPITYLVPLMVLLDLISAVRIGSGGREHMSKPELKHLVPFMFAGFVLGITVMVKVPPDAIRMALGVFALAIGVNGIVNPVLHRRISRWWSIPAGLFGGAVATVFGAGGPIYATYLSGRLIDKGEIRATLSGLISISALARAVVYAAGGLLFHATIFIGMVALAPFAWVGLTLGTRIHVNLSQEQMRRAIGALLVLTGASLIVRAFA